MSTQKPCAAIYCRVATADDFALERQRESMLRFAKEKGFENPTEYLDNGQKGTTIYRPAFEELAGAILQGQIQTVLIQDPSRISRDVSDYYEWLRKITELGVTVISQSGDVYDEDILFLGTMPPDLRKLLDPNVEDNEGSDDIENGEEDNDF